MYILNTDGGSRGNPGNAAAGWVIYKTMSDDEKIEVVSKNSKFLGIQTNNFAEYTAIVEGMKECLQLGIKDLEVRMDSELAMKQITGQYKIKNPQIQIFASEIKDLRKMFNTIKFVHVYREKNKEADKMVNECLDKNVTRTFK